VNGPQHGAMSAAEMRAAQAAYGEVRGQVLLEVKATSVDVAAVVRVWRELCRSGPRWKDVPGELRVALDALADGWPT
jgi:hypothetical protein